VIERAVELMLANYAFDDRAKQAAADVRERTKRGEYDSVTTMARLAELLGRHLADATSDRHVQVKLGSERVPDPWRPSWRRRKTWRVFVAMRRPRASASAPRACWTGTSAISK
jgi:hypothetical protein